MENVSRTKMISYFSLLFIICILSFLIAKYILRSDINIEDIPVDTSKRIGE